MDGRLEPEQLLSSIRTLARELGISARELGIGVITIKKAWELLEAENLIYTRPRKGSSVNGHPSDGLSTKRVAPAVERFGRTRPITGR